MMGLQRWRWKQECERRKEHRKERARPSSVCMCAHSCDSVTTARPLDLRDCCCQSLSPLFYCETTQVSPGVRASVRARLSHIRASSAFRSFAPSEHRSDCLSLQCHAVLIAQAHDHSSVKFPALDPHTHLLAACWDDIKHLWEVSIWLKIQKGSIWKYLVS